MSSFINAKYDNVGEYDFYTKKDLSLCKVKELEVHIANEFNVHKVLKTLYLF